MKSLSRGLQPIKSISSQRLAQAKYKNGRKKSKPRSLYCNLPKFSRAPIIVTPLILW